MMSVGTDNSHTQSKSTTYERKVEYDLSKYTHYDEYEIVGIGVGAPNANYYRGTNP